MPYREKFAKMWRSGSLELFMLLVCAFAVRFWLLMAFPHPLMVSEQDAASFMANATDILHARALQDTFRPPFFSIIIAIFSFLPLHMETAARVASISMDSLVVIPLYCMTRLFLPRNVAVAASILWAVFPLGLTTVTSPLSHSTYLFFLMSGAYLLARLSLDMENLILGALAGVSIAAAYLTRPEGLAVLAYAVLLLMAILLIRRDFRPGPLKTVLVCIGAFILCSLPYWIFLHNRLGFWTFSGKAAIVIQGGFDTREILDASKGGVRLWLEKHGGLLGGMKNSWNNFTQYGAAFFNSFPWWLHLLSWIGLPGLFISGRRFFGAALLLLPFVTLPVYLFNVTRSVSYVYPLFPFFIVAIAMGMERTGSLAKFLAERLFPKGRPFGERLRLIVMAILVSWYCVVSMQNVLAEYRSPEAWEQSRLAEMFKDAGLFINSASTPADIIMTRWGVVSYYAERPMQVIPKGDIGEVVAAARKGRVSFLVIDTFSVGSRRQELAPLLEPLGGGRVNPGYGLQLVWYRLFDVGGYLVYRVLP